MIICRQLPVDAVDARTMLRAYVTELVDRWNGRTMPRELVDQVMLELPNDDLVAFLVAYRSDATVAAEPHAACEPVGCVGLRLLEPSIGEVKRMYVVPHARRHGIGGQLLGTLEAQARGHGLGELRLDTRGDLVEARALYARHGFTEIPAYNDDPYAQHWFAKHLHPAAQP